MENKETELFYNDIENKYREVFEQLIDKDCQKVEFLRGKLSVYSEIIMNQNKWKSKSFLDPF